jgi:hypothetical protein
MLGIGVALTAQAKTNPQYLAEATFYKNGAKYPLLSR